MAETELSLAFLSVITLQEIQAGLEMMPDGHRRKRFEAWFATDILLGYEDRTLAMTKEIALLAGKLLAKVRRSGHNPGLADVQIAATAIHHGMALATLNRKHFARLDCPVIHLEE